MKRTIFALAVLTAVSSANAVSYFDGEFAIGDYGHFAYFDSASTSTLRAVAGGNPGATLHHNIEHIGSTPQGRGRIGSYNFNFVYNPSVSGAISSLNMSADYLLDTQAVLSGQALSFSLIQNGDTYFKQFLGNFSPNNWVHASISADATGWTKVDWVSGGFSAANPDFSAAGGEMTFGFLSGYVLSGNAKLTQRIDNFSVQTTPVPEPATMAILGLGAVGAIARRRKRS